MINDQLASLPRHSLADCNSRFCFLKFTKPAHENHLQAPLRLQALTFVYHDRFVFSILLLLTNESNLRSKEKTNTHNFQVL